MELKNYQFYKLKAGIISHKALYVLYDKKRSFMYESETLFGLIKKCILEWKHERNLIG